MDAEDIDIEAFAHPNAKPTLNECASGKKAWDGWGKWGHEKADEFRAEMKEQQHEEGIFKRRVC
jgi:hypothetical protein